MKAGKQSTGASRKKKKKQQVKAISQGDDTGYVARVDGDGGAASSEVIRRVRAKYSRILGVQAIVALCFFGFFLCAESVPMGAVGMGATPLRQGFICVDNFRSKAWQGRVHMRVLAPYAGRKGQQLVLDTDD